MAMIYQERTRILVELGSALDRATGGRVTGEGLTEHSGLADDLDLSSLDLLELSFELQDLWGLDMTSTDAGQLRTVCDVIDAIQDHVTSGNESLGDK